VRLVALELGLSHWVLLGRSVFDRTFRAKDN